MKYNGKIEQKREEVLETEQAIANENETENEVAQQTLSLEDMLSFERKIVVDKNTAIKYCEVVDEKEIVSAIKLRSKDFAEHGGEMSFSIFCANHPLEAYMPEKPKRVRKIYSPYAKNPIDNFLYSIAFKWASYSLRKQLQWSNNDTRLVPIYCNCLANTQFKDHSEVVKDLVQTVLAQMASCIREDADKFFRHKAFEELENGNEFELTNVEFVGIDKSGDEYDTLVCKLTGETELEYWECEMKVNLADNYRMYRACLRSVSEWVSHNSVFVGGYDKHKKNNVAFDGYMSEWIADYKQTRELLRVESSVEWIARRKEVLDSIAKVRGGGELRCYEAVLDLLHDCILPFGNDEELSPWTIKILAESIQGNVAKDLKTRIAKDKTITRCGGDLNVKITGFTEYKNIGKGKFKSVYNYHIMYRDDDALKTKYKLDLNAVKSTLFAYLKAFAE